MALSKERKQTVVAEVAELLASSKLTVLARYPGTSVTGMQQLRGMARAQGTTVRVIKNRLFKVAMDSLPAFKDHQPQWLTGQLIYAFNADDEAAPAQVLAAFAKLQPQIEFVGALGADGLIMAADELKELAALPTKDQLLTQLVGVLSAPLRGLVSVAGGNLDGLAQVLVARSEALQTNN